MHYLLSALLFFFVPLGVSAATLSLRAEGAPAGVGDTILVEVVLDSDAPVNAFSGTVRYPQDLLEPVSISDGSSIVSVWLARPQEKKGEIVFEGLTPGGFSGRQGEIFGALFKVKAAGAAALALGDVLVLRNDGAGGEEPVQHQTLALALLAEPQGGYMEKADTNPPEPFELYFGEDPALFVFRDYVVFSPVDKGSGVATLEVRERRPFWFGGAWHPVESPYVLKDQSGASLVEVRATDRAGNVRTGSFPQRVLLQPYEWALLGLILSVLAAIVLLRRLLKK